MYNNYEIIVSDTIYLSISSDDAEPRHDAQSDGQPFCPVHDVQPWHDERSADQQSTDERAYGCEDNVYFYV